ncbi:MAG: hypothetical protein ACQGVC_10680 [Myxococcota bacterium]
MALLVASGAQAESEDPRAASERRWVPSFAFIGGVTIQNQDAETRASCANGGPAVEDVQRTNPPGGQIDLPACSQAPNAGFGEMRPTTSDDQDVLSPLVAGSLQIMTPTLEFIPFRPRVFASGELITFYSPTEKIAREGSPTGAAPPQNITENTGFPAIALTGLGSQTQSEVQLLGYGAKLGIAFPFEFLGRRLWFKPSAGWIQYEVDVEGMVVHAIKDDLTPPPPPPFPQRQWGAFVREITLLGSDSATLQGIGPGAEIEMEAGVFGPIGVNIFIEGHAYRVAPHLFGQRLGDRREVAIQSQTSLPLQINRFGSVPSVFGQDTYTADWSWEADPWLWRTGVGVRIQWLGR